MRPRPPLCSLTQLPCQIRSFILKIWKELQPGPFSTSQDPVELSLSPPRDTVCYLTAGASVKRQKVSSNRKYTFGMAAKVSFLRSNECWDISWSQKNHHTQFFAALTKRRQYHFLSNALYSKIVYKVSVIQVLVMWIDVATVYDSLTTSVSTRCYSENHILEL